MNIFDRFSFKIVKMKPFALIGMCLLLCYYDSYLSLDHMDDIFFYFVFLVHIINKSVKYNKLL